MSQPGPSVTIVGAGIAGMSAAHRLLEAGCSVTVYEKANHVGGQFGAVWDGSRYHEHAFHIFADWCLNFWSMCEYVGLARDKDFDPRPVFLTLTADEKRRDPDFKRLEYLGSPRHFWKNTNSGVAHWSDMLIYQYSVLDMLSDEGLADESKEFLNRVSVNGFMHSRTYASDVAALLHHELLLKVFAVPSYRTSARAYQTYLRHSAAFPVGSQPLGANEPVPSFWAMRGDVQTRFWHPLVKKLQQRFGSGRPPSERRFHLNLEMEVSAVGLTDNGRSGKGNPEPRDDNQPRWRIDTISVGPKGRPEKVEHLLLAVPPRGLEKILRNSPALSRAAPELLDVAYLEAVPVPALNLHFNRPLGLPAEHITLLDSSEIFLDDESLARKNGMGSEYGLSLIDHSQLWPSDRDTGKRPTVLSVLAGDAKALLALDEGDDAIKRRLIETLREYIPFDPAVDLTDLECDAHLQTHRDEPLFVNTEGSWEYRPEARLDEGARTYPRVRDKVANLYLAGDYCRSKIDIVSVEAAVVTGLCAAHLICDKVTAPLLPPPHDLERVQRAKALLKPWVDLATRRSRRHALAERQRVARHLKQKVKTPS